MKYHVVFDTNVLVAHMLTKHPDSAVKRLIDEINAIIREVRDEIRAAS